MNFRQSSKSVLVAICFAILSFSGQSAQASSKKGIDPSHLDIIQRISQKPELMNVSYLQYLIGFPENGRSQRGHLKRAYFWYEEPSRFLTYRLDQEGPQLNVVNRSALTINVRDSNIRLKDVEKVFGQYHKTVFDWQSNPNEIFQVSPNTYISFVIPRNSHRVKNIKIVYQGPSLPPPTFEDMDTAYQFRKSQAILAGQNGAWHEAIPWLVADVAKKPQDPVSRIKLAFAYRQHMMINESIKEYIEVLKLSQGRPEIRSDAIAALVEMRVWPEPVPQTGQPANQRTYIAGSNGELGL